MSPIQVNVIPDGSLSEQLVAFAQQDYIAGKISVEQFEAHVGEALALDAEKLSGYDSTAND